MIGRVKGFLKSRKITTFMRPWSMLTNQELVAFNKPVDVE